MAKRRMVKMCQRRAFTLSVFLLVSFTWTISPEAQESDVNEVEGHEVLPLAGYSRGFFVQSSDGDYRMRIKGRVQLRLTGLFPEEGDNEAAFMIRRARLQFTGNAFGDWLTYKLQIGYERGWVWLADFWVDIAAVPDRFYLRLGQFRRPFSREEMISGGRMQFVDRSFLQAFFGTGRDVGIALHNNYERCPPFEWVVAVMNGTSVRATLDGEITVDPETGIADIARAAFSNVPEVFHPAVVARVGYNHGDSRGYEAPDLEGGPLRLALGMAGWLDFDADGGDDAFVAGEIDGILRVKGFSLFAEAIVSAGQDGGRFADMTYRAWALSTEAGYVIGRTFQPAVRVSHLDPRGTANNRNEVTAAVNFYFIGHALKWQTDASAIFAEHEGGTALDWRLRSQVQLWF